MAESSMRKIARYGWVPDIPDNRDVMFRKVYRIPTRLPSSVDLSPQCSPVQDQGELGSCTACALVGAIEFLMIKDRKPLENLSRLFIYYNGRVVGRTVDRDYGATIRDSIKTVCIHGVCAENKWPYVNDKVMKKPSASCYKEGENWQTVSYQRVETVEEMRSCLADGYPFVFGFAVYESFESQEVAKTGVVNMPKPNEHVIGGHAVVAVGYDDTRQRFLVRNSWGDNWGMRGYFTIPYDYLANRNLSDDFWTIRHGEHM